MFQQFNRQGHRTLSAEIQQELQALAQRHGLNITAGGGQIGSDQLVIKVTAKTNDTSVIEARERRELGIYGRWVGLTERHYNAIIVERRSGQRLQLKGYSPNRPKYPLDMLDLGSGKMLKGTESYAKKFIAAVQTSTAPPIAAATAPAPTAAPTPTPAPSQHVDLGAVIAGMPQF